MPGIEGRREQVAWLLVLATIATVIDVLVITQGWYSSARVYLYAGWFAAWLVCLFITRSFLLSFAAVIVISCLEDCMYLVMCHCFTGVPIYPFYCHEWVAAGFGSWAKFLGWNWLGVPSSYFIMPAAAAVLILAWRGGWVIKLLTFLEIIPLKLCPRLWCGLLHKLRLI